MRDGAQSEFWAYLRALLDADREHIKEMLLDCDAGELTMLQAKAANLQHLMELPDIIIGIAEQGASNE